MITKNSLTGRIAVAVLLLQVIACQKPMLKEKQDDPVKLDAFYDYRDCRILQITTHGANEIANSFHYNSAGNPIIITSSQVYYPYPGYRFAYNAQGHLNSVVAPYENNLYDFWYKFYTDANGRIISDSLYRFGPMVGNTPYPNSSDASSATYQYDSQGRLVVEIRVFGSGAYTMNIYTYNSSGNRDRKSFYRNGALVRTTFYGPYDNKINIRRTHKIWQFLGQDYSLNNPIAAEKYPGYELPSRFRLDTGNQWPLLGTLYLDKSDILFSCPKTKP